MNPRIEALESTTFGSKRFTRKQLFMIQETVAEFPNLSHRELGLTICELIQWVNPAGNHKIQSCLSALKEMEKIGLFTLPAKRAIKKTFPRPWCLVNSICPVSQIIRNFNDFIKSISTNRIKYFNYFF